ncbi:MAG: glycosyltransferase family 39 protein [Propionibacteriaceae bacterium]
MTAVVPTAWRRTGAADRPRLTVAVWAVAGVVVLALLLVAGRYGFHGDEFYFVVTGRHLQVAAPDNPMLVPYLAAGWYRLVGGQLVAFRVLPALAAGAYVLLGGLTAREFGASSLRQVAAAAAVAMTALTLAVGHLFETTTFDMVATAAAVWLVVRAMRDEPHRWAPWIAVGLLTGVAMEIKILAAPLLACCLVGIAICGPRSRLRSPRLWAAVAIALLIAAPNLIWQALHGFPMLQVAANIAGGGSTSSTPRLALLPSVLLDVGPVLSIVLIVGLVVLLRSDRRGSDGWLAAGFLIFVAFLLITGGKAYYPAGLVPAVLAAGAGPVLDWVRRGRSWRAVLAVALIVVTVVSTPLLTLPIGRLGGPVFKMAAGVNPDLAAEVGWPGYVNQVGEIVASTPTAQRRDTIMLTQTYQQAAALDLLRPANGVTMPAVYSGHNGFWFWGPPPDTATDAIVIGDFSPADLAVGYSHCEVAGTVQTPPGVDNDLTGTPIRRCTGLRQPWSVLWPRTANFA